MNDEVRKAVETIRQYLDELEEEKTLDVQNILNVSDFERAVAEVLSGIGLKPRHLADHLVWSTIRDKTKLSTEHQLALLFDLIDNELKEMKLEGFEDNDHVAGMATPDNIFLYNGEHAEVDELRQTDTMNVWELAYETIIKLHKAGHPKVCRRISSAVLRNGYSEYVSLCEDLFGSILKNWSYPFHRLQINIRNIGDHNLTSIINRIREMLRKTIPDPKNKRKLRQNVPVYVIATLEKDSQQRWKDSWYWLNEAKLLKEDDPLLRFTDYKDHIGNTLSSRYNSTAYYFEGN
jgi:hypothetical protein